MSEPGEDREALVEATAGAFRGRGPHGEVQSHPAWHDLDEAGRLDEAAAQLKAAGQVAVLHQQGKVFSVDVPLAADAPAEALVILRRTGARGTPGATTRVEFAAPAR